MVLNTRKTLERMEERGLDRAAVCTKTGLSERSFVWILENGDCSVDALERIADALEVNTNEIIVNDPTMENENVIEFVRDGSSATVTFCQGRYITKIRKLAAKYPEECRIVAENKNKSIVALVPVSWIKISANKIQLTEEEIQKRTEKLLQVRSQGKICQNV